MLCLTLRSGAPPLPKPPRPDAKPWHTECRNNTVDRTPILLHADFSKFNNSVFSGEGADPEEYYFRAALCFIHDILQSTPPFQHRQSFLLRRKISYSSSIFAPKQATRVLQSVTQQGVCEHTVRKPGKRQKVQQREWQRLRALRVLRRSLRQPNPDHHITLRDTQDNTPPAPVFRARLLRTKDTIPVPNDTFPASCWQGLPKNTLVGTDFFFLCGVIEL